MSYELILGDCLDVLPSLEADSVDTCITDPPYGLSFMGKDWDHGVPGVRFWQEVYRVLKPGAFLLAFGGTRTFHRLTVAIEDAGFEIRDCMMWLQGQGFPKSHDIGKAIDKAAGEERKSNGTSPNVRPNSDRGNGLAHGTYGKEWDITAPATAAAQQWDGWGTALKPAWEPITVATKPRDGTFAENALAHGVAGLWIDGGRVPTEPRRTHKNGNYPNPNTRNSDGWGYKVGYEADMPSGRWPANVVLDEAAAMLLDEQSGERPAKRGQDASGTSIYGTPIKTANAVTPNDTGGASRFFYCAKASKSERNEGLEGLPKRQQRTTYDKSVRDDNGNDSGYARQNHHPTVKPLDLMRYLCKLTRTPTGGVVLDPFMGSGSTGCAAVLEGRDFIGIELEDEYMEIARRRITHHAEAARQLELL